MKITVRMQPYLLWDTVDLVCAWFNGVDPRFLTREGDQFIPATEIEKMMEIVCGDLDPNSNRLRLFFQGYKLDDGATAGQQLACIGCYLLCFIDKYSTGSLQKIREELREHYVGTGKPYRINSFSNRGFGWDCSDEFCTISDELDKLIMPDGLRLRLVEVLSGYHRYVDSLFDLLEPLTQRLEPLLRPWVEKQRPHIKRWFQALHTDAEFRNFTSRFNINLDECREIVMTPRMLYPGDCWGSYTRNGVLYCRAGIGIRIGQAKDLTLSSNELAALRQFSSADRIEMLRIMAGQAMGPREVCRKLGINPGTAFRDLNNMAQAHLLKIMPKGNSHIYTTDIDFLKETVKRLVEYIESGK